MQGGLLIDKPSGPTSHDIVAFVRRTLKTSRVGHTGTLDPLATGLLVVLVGHATRLAQFLVADEKEYIADVRLGVSTPTYDAASLDAGGQTGVRLGSDWGQTGVRVGSEWGQTRVGGVSDPGLTPAAVERVLDGFRGTFLQTPPPFSAKKVAGVRAYEKARKDEPIELKPVHVTVRELEVLDTSPIGHRPSVVETGGLLRLRVAASSGFYVRSLAHDIGQRLGCGAHLEALRRTRVGRFRVEDACTLETLEAQGGSAACAVPVNTLLGHLPEVTLTDEGRRRAGNGNSLAPHHLAGGPTGPPSAGMHRLLGAGGELLAVAERRADGLLHPLVVLR